MKKLILPVLAIALVAGLTATPAFAKGAKAPKTPEAQYSALDTNSDGKVTLDEYKASPKAVKLATKHPEKVDATFKAMDANGDGNVTLDEFKAYTDAQAAKAAAKKAKAAAK